MERMGGLPFFPWRHGLCDVVVIMERTGGLPFFSWRHGLCDEVVIMERTGGLPFCPGVTVCVMWWWRGDCGSVEL